MIHRLFALEFVRVTEAAAIAAAQQMGHGDQKNADRLAVDAMRKMLRSVDFDGTVQIGEGERDQAPMLYIGEKVGTGQGQSLDVALDPLEGTALCAQGAPNALSLIAVAEQGGLLHAPDVYMNKIAVGGEGSEVIDLLKSPAENVRLVAEKKGKDVSHMTVVIMDRPRHAEMIADIRQIGARIVLITDGDVQPAVACGLDSSGIDMVMGIGGAPEGVLSAAALKCLGGGFQGQLVFHKKGTHEVDDDQLQRAHHTMGLEDPQKIFTLDELVKGPVIFSATGVTDGSLLGGVKFLGNQRVKTHSLVMRSETRTVRFLTTDHDVSSHSILESDWVL